MAAHVKWVADTKRKLLCSRARLDNTRKIFECSLQRIIQSQKLSRLINEEKDQSQRELDNFSPLIVTRDKVAADYYSFLQIYKMSLYYESVPFLHQDSLKSSVFSASLKSSPKQVFALVSEASKWSSILKEVIENSRLLSSERKVS